MADIKQLEIIKQGPEAWNKWRKENPGVNVDLTGANLSGANLSEANLNGALLSGADLSETNLSEANLRRASLSETDLTGANLSMATLNRADLSRAKLIGAKLIGAKLILVDLLVADLSQADLSQANLSEANLSGADLSEANFCGANLSEAKLIGADLSEANLERTIVGATSFGDIDLQSIKSLETVQHDGPSTIGIDTLRNSKGRIPGKFLRGCGLSPWEIEFSKLYDPALTPYEIAEILDAQLFQKRTDGPIYIGGIFISYSWSDTKFVDKLYDRLLEEGASVWLDRHDMVAGDVQRQVVGAIRRQDIVITVLSENSIESDWVEKELEDARDKEKKEKRDVLCPVAIDDSWKDKKNDVLWRQLKKKNILDFSGWKTKKFNTQFEKLIKGLKINYEVRSDISIGPKDKN